jgi:HNH endonuclease
MSAPAFADSRLEERFWSRICVAASGCWEWNGPRDEHNYGRISVGYFQHGAHRFVYQALVGPIPDGLQLDHLCRNPPCVNPAHLEPVTPRENLLRGDTIAAANAAKTHCPQGHPYSPENTRLASGKRRCRRCESAAGARRYQRRKAECGPLRFDPPADLVPVTGWAWKRRHYAHADQMQDDPRRPGRYGVALCNQDGGRFYDQEWMTAVFESGVHGSRTIADLPLCQRCEKSVARLASGLSGGAR